MFLFSSFCDLALKIIVQERDVDLLLVDSGDLHDGMYCVKHVAIHPP